MILTILSIWAASGIVAMIGMSRFFSHVHAREEAQRRIHHV